jgi:hypothetical protein
MQGKLDVLSVGEFKRSIDKRRNAHIVLRVFVPTRLLRVSKFVHKKWKEEARAGKGYLPMTLVN